MGQNSTQVPTLVNSVLLPELAVTARSRFKILPSTANIARQGSDVSQPRRTTRLPSDPEVHTLTRWLPPRGIFRPMSNEHVSAWTACLHGTSVNVSMWFCLWLYCTHGENKYW